MNVGVYLAGAIRVNVPVDYTWRDKVTAAIRDKDVAVLDPMHGKTVNSGAFRMCGKFSLEPNSILQQDCASIARSDIVFMNLLSFRRSDYPFIGTLAELGIAIATHKLLIVIADNPTVTEHPFVKAGATRILPTLDEGIEYLKSTIDALRG